MLVTTAHTYLDSPA